MIIINTNLTIIIIQKSLIGWMVVIICGIKVVMVQIPLGK